MNTRILIAAALAFAGTSAFAGGEFDPMTGFNLNPTPARAVTTSAAKPAAPASAGLTREQVKAEFLKTRNEDSVADNFERGNDYARAPVGAGRDREEVRAEARASVRGGKSGS
jgi:hypothetical protein